MIVALSNTGVFSVISSFTRCHNITTILTKINFNKNLPTKLTRHQTRRQMTSALTSGPALVKLYSPVCNVLYCTVQSCLSPYFINHHPENENYMANISCIVLIAVVSFCSNP